MIFNGLSLLSASLIFIGSAITSFLINWYFGYEKGNIETVMQVAAGFLVGLIIHQLTLDITSKRGNLTPPILKIGKRKAKN